MNTRKGNEPAWLTILALVAVAIALTATGCGASADAQDDGAAGEATETAAEPATHSEDGTGDEDGEGDEEQAVPVSIAVLERGPIEAVLRFSANLEAEEHVEVHAQAARLVVKLNVEEGDLVRKGAVLASLQDDEQRSERSKVTVELAKARREYERQKRLFSENLISEQEFNEATYNIEQLELRLADAERELSYTEVRAPIAGTVTRRLIKLGDPVQVGQHLFDIVDFESMVARVYVPEKHVASLAPGIAARITAPSLGDGDYRGTVDRVAPVVDPKTGTVKVTVAVGAQAGLRPGLYVDVDLVTAVHPDALLVPKRALVYDDDRVFVFRMDADSRAERVSVRPRMTDKHFIEPDGGLQPGDRIVVAGQTGLKPGALIEPQEADEQETSAAEEAAMTADRSAQANAERSAT